LVNSCLIPVLQAESAAITTIEGLGDDPRLSQAQRAFLDCGGAQCGICTPGMILATHHLLHRIPKPSEEEIREALAGNLCRCTGYAQICEAVAAAANREARG
jgi:aerobic carbon-monoxide dehydrogenase small subunit